MQHFDTTLTSRYECKYLIDERRANAIRKYLAAHMELDPFLARTRDHRYRVQSLYFDTPGLELYRDTVQGTRNRYKLRYRYYGDEGKGPVFLEVKKRANIIVRKSRERVAVQEAESLLATGQFPSAASHRKDLHEFLGRCAESGARPALRIRYWREAWESRSVDPVRITFDTEVEHCMLCDLELTETFPAWRRPPLIPRCSLRWNSRTIGPSGSIKCCNATSWTKYPLRSTRSLSTTSEGSEKNSPWNQEFECPRNGHKGRNAVEPPR